MIMIMFDVLCNFNEYNVNDYYLVPISKNDWGQMYEWMTNVWMNEWMNEQINGEKVRTFKIDKPINEWMDEWLNEWTIEWISGYLAKI